jgi:serine/threonine-protein kinase CHEK1
MLTDRCGSLPYVAPEVRLSLLARAYISPIHSSQFRTSHIVDRPSIAGVSESCCTLYSLAVGHSNRPGTPAIDPEIDTPWDEPTINSPEFIKYQRGTIWNETPWNRITGDAAGMGSLSLNIRILTCSQ